MLRRTQQHVDALAEMEAAAEWEAERFSFPPDWAEGRAIRRGSFAIDSETTRDRDDAIAVSVLPGKDGRHIMNVSIVDVGSFLDRFKTPAIEAYAREVLATRYGGHSARRPMLPRLLSEKFLSIGNNPDGAGSPVLTISMVVEPDGSIADVALSLEQLRPIILSYNDVAAIKDDPGAHYHNALETQEYVARLLRSNRLDKKPPASRESRVARPGQHIVSEAMIAANRGLGQFMSAYRIPRLHRNHDGQLAVYSVRARGHKGLNLDEDEPYVYGSSPLRDISAFANNCNVVAFLRGEPVPYDVDQLNAIAQRYNVHQERQRLIRLERRRLLGAGAVAATGMPRPQMQPAA